MDEREPRPGEEEAPSPETDPVDALGEALGGAVEQLQEIAAQLRRLIEVRLDRVRLGARERVFRLGLWTLALISGGVLVSVAVSRLASGLSGLIEGLGGATWAGDLGAALILLLLCALLGLGIRASLRRRGLERLRSRYRDDEPALHGREEGASRD